MAHANRLPSVSEIEKHLAFDYKTGVFTRKATNRQCLGTTSNGYIYITIGDKHYSASRLAWMMYYQEDPFDSLVDHINRDIKDNRKENLRLANKRLNAHNCKLYATNTSGIKGASYKKDKRRWKAEIMAPSGMVFLGYFVTKEEAGAAYIGASRVINGEFAREK